MSNSSKINLQNAKIVPTACNSANVKVRLSTLQTRLNMAESSQIDPRSSSNGAVGPEMGASGGRDASDHVIQAVTPTRRPTRSPAPISGPPAPFQQLVEALASIEVASGGSDSVLYAWFHAPSLAPSSVPHPRSLSHTHVGTYSCILAACRSLGERPQSLRRF